MPTPSTRCAWVDGCRRPARWNTPARQWRCTARCAPLRGRPPTPGFLASARSVRLHVPRLDDRAGPLQVQATRMAGDGGQALYRFVLADRSGRALVDGRAAVVLNQTLASPGA